MTCSKEKRARLSLPDGKPGGAGNAARSRRPRPPELPSDNNHGASSPTATRTRGHSMQTGTTRPVQGAMPSEARQRAGARRELASPRSAPAPRTLALRKPSGFDGFRAQLGGASGAFLWRFVLQIDLAADRAQA